jgi:putative endonuclease
LNTGNTINIKSVFLENVALRWLKARGLKVVAKNYLSRAGEIDLIMLDGDTLCFIDVEYQASHDSDSTDYSFPESKRQKIIKIASSFVNHQNKYLKYSTRFDALFVQPDIDQSFKINWVQDLFKADFSPGK